MAVINHEIQRRGLVNDASIGKRTSSSHLPELDFLRGVAALGVVWYHLVGRIGLPPVFQHGYLGVDFFFVLSGFVIAYAYEKRLAKGTLSLPAFLVIRMIRLLPLILIGLAIGALVEIGRPNIDNQHHHIQDIIYAFALGSLLLPILFPTTLDQATFPLNGPLWSLSVEFFSNIVFAVWAKYLYEYLIVYAVTFVCGILFVYETFGHGTADMGSLPRNFLSGFIRIGWSFGIGMIIYRKVDLRFHTSAWVPAALFVGVILPPISQSYNAIYDSVVTVIILPLIVCMSKSCLHSNSINKLATISGNISYPLYLIHYPIVRLICNKINHINPSSTVRVAVVALTTVVLVGTCHLIFRIYDYPVRYYLRCKFSRFKAI